VCVCVCVFVCTAALKRQGPGRRERRQMEAR
jgi:hypothetical protein